MMTDGSARPEELWRRFGCGCGCCCCFAGRGTGFGLGACGKSVRWLARCELSMLFLVVVVVEGFCWLIGRVCLFVGPCVYIASLSLLKCRVMSMEQHCGPATVQTLVAKPVENLAAPFNLLPG